MIKEYLLLQYRMLNRNLLAFGIQPLVAYILSIVLFLGFSEIVFVKTDYAYILYPMICLFCLSQIASFDKVKFLKNIFLKLDYYKIRFIENCIICIPFLGWLVFKSEWYATLFLILAGIAMTFLDIKSSANFTIPTPFGKNPFEHSVGFRMYFPLILLAYFVSVMGIQSENFNLNMFALSMVFIISILCYNKQEERYLVWMHSDPPSTFLFKKIKYSIIHSLVLVLPLLIALMIVYSESILIILLITLLGCLNVINMLLAKYSAYPLEISLPQGILLIVALAFPPVLIITIPHFFIKAKSRLIPILA